ncbi:MAG: LacI family DNA-binding transcriptional regulator [Coprobacillus sp.]
MATIKDIADLAGVSSASVSRILNNDTSLNVPYETRDKVFQAAKELGYEKKKRKFDETVMTIGIIQWISPVQEVEDPYYLSVRQGVEDYCFQNKIAIKRVFQTDIDFLNSLDSIEGLICIGKYSKKDMEDFKKVCSNIIFLDMNINPIYECNIVLDFKNAMKSVVDYLHQYNHKTIGYLGGKEYTDDGQIYPDNRKKYFMRYCDEYNIQYHDYILEDAFSIESGFTMMNEMIESKNLPSAIFAASDPIAIGALRALNQKGIRVPEDISLIGFDNIDTVNYTSPPLTTVYTPTFDMGFMGARMIYDAFKRNENISPIRIQMPCFLIERESCKKRN